MDNQTLLQDTIKHFNSFIELSALYLIKNDKEVEIQSLCNKRLVTIREDLNQIEIALNQQNAAGTN